MARSRLELQQILEDILSEYYPLPVDEEEGDETEKEQHLIPCYFSPPSDIQMSYPCICYSLSRYTYQKADNQDYLGGKTYTVTVIDEDPDSEIPDKVKERLAYCTFDRSYVADGLNHYVFTIIF